MNPDEAQLSPSEVRVYLLTENRLLRESLARLLLKKAGICVVGVSGSLGTGPEEIAACHCEVLLTDCITTPLDTCILRRIVELDEHVKVVLFGMEENLEIFLQVVCLGVCGYLLKEASGSEIVSATRAVANDGAVCPPKLCKHLFKRIAQQVETNLKEMGVTNKLSLTARQAQLVSLVAKGLTNKEIAASLNLSQFTVKNHMRRILKLVDAQDRYDAVNAIRASGVLPVA